MPYRIPAHIFDIDDATAQRLVQATIRRRVRNRRLAVALAVFALVASAALAAVV